MRQLIESIATEAIYLRKVLFNLKCVKTAPIIKAQIPIAPIFTITIFEDCNITAEEIFKIPTKSLNHVGNWYSINSFLMLSYLTTQTKKIATPAIIFKISVILCEDISKMLEYYLLIYNSKYILYNLFLNVLSVLITL